jgi:hypothetical protein
MSIESLVKILKDIYDATQHNYPKTSQSHIWVVGESDDAIASPAEATAASSVTTNPQWDGPSLIWAGAEWQ